MITRAGTILLLSSNLIKFKKMLSSDVESLTKLVQEQGNLVRQLKEQSANKIDIDLAVKELKIRKKKLDEFTESENSNIKKSDTFDRVKMEDLLLRRFFYNRAFEIYGGVAGLYDYGPMGASMEANIMNLWRKHFVLNDQMMEIRCSQLTPSCVLKASGHVDRFADFMVKDLVTGDCYRADHLLKAQLEKMLLKKSLNKDMITEYENVLRQIDNFDQQTLHEMMTKYNVKAPGSNNDISAPMVFNLMFGTSIGPTGSTPGFLRPETAQGIFVNFKRLLEFNNGQLPFACVQIGCSFRNEISPRSGILRVREFLMAEIEHFVDPSDKSHKKFHLVENEELLLYSSDIQMNGMAPVKMSLKAAVVNGIIKNSSVAYFLGRIKSFMLAVGINEQKMRFRQHLPNEMAHYACDCWDCELETSYGWVECVGCADRACFDLEQHTKFSGTKLVARIDLEKPIQKDKLIVEVNNSILAKKFRADTPLIVAKLADLSEEEFELIKIAKNENKSYCLKVEDKIYEIEPLMINKTTKKSEDIYVREVFPHVIEPSFGIGRIMYAIFEHNFQVREEDQQRMWLSLPAEICPIKCAILPISNNKEFEDIIQKAGDALTSNYISFKIDNFSGSIGRRYARSDEIAIPFIITIDFDSLKLFPASITLRERNSKQQIRCELNEAIDNICQLIKGIVSWDSIVKKYGLFQGQTSIIE